ncbi:MAG: AAA family ATPase [Ilumatobacteraceae bacterium]
MVGHVARDRLVRVIASHPVVVLEAPSGYGKTTLAMDAARALDLTMVRIVPPASGDLVQLIGEVRRGFALLGVTHVGLDEPNDATTVARALAAVLADAETLPLMVLVDEAQRLTGDTRGFVRELALEWYGPHRLVVAGRRVPPVINAGVALTARDLAFDADETAGLADEPAIAAELEKLRVRVDGWPAALSLAANRAGGSHGTGRGAQHELEELVDDIVGGLDPEVVQLVVALAHLPAFGPAVARALGGQRGWEIVRDTGIPIVELGAGTVRFSDPVIECLTWRARLAEDAARTAATALVELGEPRLAVSTLLDGGLAHDAADLIGALRARELASFDRGELRAIDDLIHASTGARRGDLALQRARLAALGGAIGERGELLTLAAARAADSNDQRLANEIASEQVRDLARLSETEAALRRGTELLGALAPDEHRARAVVLSALGLAEAASPTGSVDRAIARLGEAITLFRLAGDDWDESLCLHWTAYWGLYLHGRFDEAIATQRAAIERLGPDDGQRAMLATFLGEMHTALGDADAAIAVLADAFRLGRRRGDQLTIAYAAWVAAEAATLAGDLERVRFHVAEAERCRGEWWDHTTGTDLLAEVSQMFRRLGAVDDARAYLERAAGRPEGTVPTVRFARAALEAEHGDADLAIAALAQLDTEDSLFVAHRPRLRAMQAVAHLRRGDEGAADIYATAEAEAAALGLSGLLATVEPTLATLFRPGERGPARRHIQLLGGFSVTIDGVDATPPPGRGSTLVKALAVADVPLSLDEILELLWPGEDPAVARRRLRNLLNRIRDDATGVVVRTAAGLALAPGFTTDLDEFRSAARAALDDTSNPELGRRAVAAYTGELLPGDRYEDWSALPREQCTRLYCAVLDALATGAAARGDLAVAMAHADRAIAAEPFDETRPVQAAHWALDAGRSDQARAYLALADRVVAELGVRDPPGLERARARLAAR